MLKMREPEDIFFIEGWDWMEAPYREFWFSQGPGIACMDIRLAAAAGLVDWEPPVPPDPCKFDPDKPIRIIPDCEAEVKKGSSLEV